MLSRDLNTERVGLAVDLLVQGGQLLRQLVLDPVVRGGIGHRVLSQVVDVPLVSGFKVDGFWTAFWASLFSSLLSLVLGAFVLGGSPDSVDILIVDVKSENWSTGGKLWSEPRT